MKGETITTVQGENTTKVYCKECGNMDWFIFIAEAVNIVKVNDTTHVAEFIGLREIVCRECKRPIWMKGKGEQK